MIKSVPKFIKKVAGFYLLPPNKLSSQTNFLPIYVGYYNAILSFMNIIYLIVIFLPVLIAS